MSLIKSGIIVGFFTLLSRIFGYIRDVFIASYLGTGQAADAFTIAFKLPNLFRTIFAEGAFSASFVPIFAGKLSNDGKSKALHMANITFTILFLVLVVVVTLFEIFMPLIMYVLAPGFIDNIEKFDLVIKLSRITFPYLMFISLATLFTGVLNSFGKFAIASFLPVLLNICMIFVVVMFSESFSNPALALSVGVVLAGLVQLFTIYISATRAGIIVKLTKPEFSDDIKIMFKNILPAIAGSSITQINLWIGTIIATHIAGAVSILYYAERLNQFPLAIVGTAIGTVLLPTLSKQIRSKKYEDANNTQNIALDVSLFLTLPCAFALILTGQMVVSVLFERDAFTQTDTENVARTLIALASGLPAFVMIKIFIPRFFANLDTKTPLKISFISVIANILLSLILCEHFQYVGIALASAISGWINVILLVYVLLRKKTFSFSKGFLIRLLKIIFSCLLMSFSLYLLQDILMIESKLSKLSIIILISSLVYLIASYLLGLFNFISFKKIIKRE